jgi:polyvinyl alcohol dehydrogenase (cytochrome)
MAVKIIRCVTVCLLVLAGLLCGHYLIGRLSASEDQPERWRLAGHDLNNSRSQPEETHISPSNVSRLAAKWVFTTGGDVSATPTVSGRVVYFPDWGGNLYAVHADTGRLLWSHQIAQYTGRAGSISRVSPAIFGDTVIIGDNLATPTQHDGAHVIAVDRQSGALRWITQVDAHPAAIITASPVVSGTTVYVGVSSNEEALAVNPAYPCCTFRGSVVALDTVTGEIRWKTFTVPDNGGLSNGYSGNAVWGPAAIDIRRGTLFAGTGNNYTVPDSVEACQQHAIDSGDQHAHCTATNDYFDALVALDLRTGAIKWAHTLFGYDAWTVACLAAPVGVNCPSPSGPDYDFGSGPNLLDDLVGIGQKSGIYWALNPDTGKIIWSTIVGPGGTTGGIQWGTATDGRRIYVAISNSSHTAYTLANGGPTITWGSWAALDARSGKIVWQVADPTPGAIDPGSVSVANDVMYAGSYSGGMHALHARTGRILWSFASGGSVLDGPSIVNGTLFWGSGYVHLPPGVPNNKVYAFSVPAP